MNVVIIARGVVQFDSLGNLERDNEKCEYA